MDIPTLDKISELSSNESTLAISILGASLAAILSTSYLQPSGKLFRFTYILFFPGWYFLANSLYYGNLVPRHIIQGYQYFKDGIMLTAEGQKNAAMLEDNLATHFSLQLDNFKYALCCFGLWLILYLFWFILRGSSEQKPNER